ncbi:MAG: glycosyltransferase family 2 protein [Acidobacteria bacterium]|nr:glycosyltransferase family 2 protein [Acidobacteriota bacterium]MCW5969253.1 glycosyltransferase family 2 protein [Blastocatellales bacterium]
MSSAQPSVWLIVLGYNAREVLRRCLESLGELTYARLHILVVDNGSNDGTEAMVRSAFAGIDFLQTGANLGYTGGNNRGVERAIAAGADYVLILNPDTIVLNPRFIDEMVAYLEAHPGTGIAGPRVYLRDAVTVQNTVLFAPGFMRNLKHWFRYRRDPKSLELSGDSVIEAETLNGVCLMVRVECLKQTGLFDENIFMYIEDADLDYRARSAGWSVRYLPIDSVIHAQKRDGYGMTSDVSFLLRRNSVYFLHKIGRRADAWGYAIASLALMLARGFVYENDFGEHLRFCRRLWAAYRQILSGMRLDRDFGPPYV